MEKYLSLNLARLKASFHLKVAFCRLLVGVGRGRGHRREKKDESPEDFIRRQIRLHVGSDHLPRADYTRTKGKGGKSNFSQHDLTYFRHSVGFPDH